MSNLADAIEYRMKNNYCRQDPDDRVVVIIDIRNLTNRQNSEYCNTEMDYGKLVDDLVGCRKCIAAIAVDSFVPNAKGRDSCQMFHNQLRGSGLRAELVPMSNNMGKQDGVDVKIALLAQCYAIRGQCDSVELVSGDGDFTVLVHELQNLGINVNVTSFAGHLSYSLMDAADQVNIMDDMPLIPMRPRIDAEVARMCYEGEYPDETEVIRFDIFGSPFPKGRAADGNSVFVDRYMGVPVALGETWICRLVRRSDMNGGQYYFAWPIDKVQARAEPDPIVADDNALPLGEFIAIGNDTIRSTSLEDGRYSVYRSFNGCTLQLLRDPRGIIVCRNNEISVEGLDNILGSDLPRALDFNCRGDSIMIRVEQRNDLRNT